MTIETAVPPNHLVSQQPAANGRSPQLPRTTKTSQQRPFPPTTSRHNNNQLRTVNE
ncbi:MAG: hypothetical protein IAF02_18665 [Anaerolineae bacterium]|nr:hypothetical protein [Anaerolineae bacterium]